MLNITENSISNRISLNDFGCYLLVRPSRVQQWTIISVLSILLLCFICLFLPWTQNISAKGYVTPRSPESRPQGVQAVIDGQIKEWYVQEGDFVFAGDTIAYLTEVKNEYFDPELVERTAEQVSAKEASAESYNDKVGFLGQQYDALLAAQRDKLEQVENKILQARNKIQIDSADLLNYEANLAIAENQVTRIQELYDQGLKSLSELQEKQLKVQQSRAKVLVQRNKLENQRNELINATVDLSLTRQEYLEKLAKTQSEQQTAISNRAASLGDVAKLRNQLSNYATRRQFYHIIAPQDGFLSTTVKTGIGEIIKAGDNIATIVPTQYDLAVELYVKPQDLPLLDIEEQARLRFDGWPAIVISGWPEASVGIFEGKVVAIDRFISDNGLYRILISPDRSERDWPAELRAGTGANAFILLKDVPVWYEIWRQLNGFPAEYYREGEAPGKDGDVKKKAPLKSVK